MVKMAVLWGLVRIRPAMRLPISWRAPKQWRNLRFEDILQPVSLSLSTADTERRFRWHRRALQLLGGFSVRSNARENPKRPAHKPSTDRSWFKRDAFGRLKRRRSRSICPGPTSCFEGDFTSRRRITLRVSRDLFALVMMILLRSLRHSEYTQY